LEGIGEGLAIETAQWLRLKSYGAARLHEDKYSESSVQQRIIDAGLRAFSEEIAADFAGDEIFVDVFWVGTEMMWVEFWIG
jgi:hypothetical protein